MVMMDVGYEGDDIVTMGREGSIAFWFENCEFILQEERWGTEGYISQHDTSRQQCNLQNACKSSSSTSEALKRPYKTTSELCRSDIDDFSITHIEHVKDLLADP